MITSIKVAIEEAVIKSRKLKEGIIKGRWREVVGDLNKKSQPLFIRDETLYVLVENSIFLHHMNMNKNKYMEKIEDILKDRYVKDIKFKISSIENNIQISADDMYINSNKEDEAVESSGDKIKIDSLDDIEASIQRLKSMSKKRETFLLKKGCKRCKKCGMIFEMDRDLCVFCSKKKDN